MTLTAREIDTAKPSDKPYRLADGKGLYLQVMPNGSKYWRYNYIFDGRQKTKAYGAYPAVTLAKARELHAETKELLDKGIDPNESGTKDGRAERYSFKTVAQSWIDANAPTWTTKHARQVLTAFEMHVFKEIGSDDIRDIERTKLVKLVQTIQLGGIHETTHRIAQRIGAIFDYAVDTGLLKAHPASHLVRALKAKPPVKSHAAISRHELPELLYKIEHYDGDEITRVGLNLLAHTFLRTTEIIKAEWAEFDFDKRIWLVPAARMKLDKPHVIPLTPQTCKVLERARELSGGSKYVLAAYRKPANHISNNAMLYALYRMGYHGRMTGHGFRAVASTALNEAGFNDDAIERQLAHKETDDVRAAYNRAEFLEERIKFMAWWSDFLDSERARHTV